MLLVEYIRETTERDDHKQCGADTHQHMRAESCHPIEHVLVDHNERILNGGERTHTSRWVRSPATQLSRPRSIPTILPNTAATTKRRMIWCSGSMCVSLHFIALMDSSCSEPS